MTWQRASDVGRAVSLKAGYFLMHFVSHPAGARRRRASVSGLPLFVWLVAPLMAVVTLTPPALAQNAAGTVAVYTTREKPLIEPILDVFRSLTGNKVEATYLKADEAGRFADDAAAGKVDLLIATELGQLADAKAKGLTAAPSSPSFAAALPATLRDPEGHWYALTTKLRVIVAARDRVAQKAFTYEELSEPKWKGKVCVRSGLHPYNVGLVASFIAHKGEAAAETWLRGLKSNLAQPPTGGDRDQVLAVASGKCDVALVNSYYVGMLRSAADRPEIQQAANAVTINFPNAGDRGANRGISGMALMKNARNRDAATMLMDFLLSEPAQFVYAQDNHEYPARTGVEPSGLVESWGTPKADALPLSDLAKAMPAAVELIKKVDFDKGAAG